MENHHFNGKIHYKWPFSIAMLVHQRASWMVSLFVLRRFVEIGSLNTQQLGDCDKRRWKAWPSHWSSSWRVRISAEFSRMPSKIWVARFLLLENGKPEGFLGVFSLDHFDELQLNMLNLWRELYFFPDTYQLPGTGAWYHRGWYRLGV